MKVRRVLLDVDRAKDRPDALALARAIDQVSGVEGANLTVTDIDMETVGMDITVEGEDIDVDALILVIERQGAAVHSIDEIVVGSRVVERVLRAR